MNKISIIIGADLAPTREDSQLFSDASINELFGADLLKVLKSSDFRIFNLETPLTDSIAPILKNGPSLKAPVETINGIKALNPSLVTIANNHIMDYGKLGYQSTVKTLEYNGIPFVGANESLNSANKPYILEKNGVRVGIYACAEHEFSIATEDAPGANPFDPLESLDHVSDLKSKCHYVIVLYHGGTENYQYPSPALRKVCRKLVDKGADLVICQHSHCIGCREIYKNGTVVFGQGNFIFKGVTDELWQSGLLIKVNFDENMVLDYLPIVSKDNLVRIADEFESKDIMSGFFDRSEKISLNGFIESEYRRFTDIRSDQYLRALYGADGLCFRVLNKLLCHRLIYKVYSKKALLGIRNYVECEAHREAILTYLHNYLP